MTGAALHAPARGRLLAPIPEREITPGGWVADQLRADLRDGIVGHLDRLAPDLVVDDDIFGRDRLRPETAAKDLGARGRHPPTAASARAAARAPARAMAGTREHLLVPMGATGLRVAVFEDA